MKERIQVIENYCQESYTLYTEAFTNTASRPFKFAICAGLDAPRAPFFLLLFSFLNWRCPSAAAALPCVCDGEAPLLVDVVVEQHAAQQTWRVAGGEAGGDGGGRAPVSPRPLRLQQVLPQDLHQVFVQARVFGHGGHRQGVLLGHPHACLLGHAPALSFTNTTTSSSSSGNQSQVSSFRIQKYPLKL